MLISIERSIEHVLLIYMDWMSIVHDDDDVVVDDDDDDTC